MNRRRFLTVTVGVMMLSAGLVFMTDRAGAAPKDRSGDNPTQNSWDENLSGTARFAVLSGFGGAAVRDNNTGLVWEKAPNGTRRLWHQAIRHCLDKVVPEVGGTAGWRLPSVVELRSVQDGSSTAPFIPASAFTLSNSDTIPGVQSDFYWSATKCHSCNSGGSTSEAAWGVRFNFDNDGQVVASGSLDTILHPAWCVRGPMQESLY